MAQIKPEIKVDSADSSNINMADIDEFDEAMDLQFPPEDGQPGAWLVKVSDQMWKAWNEMYQNHDPEADAMEVGTLRVYHQKPGEKQRVQLRLRRGRNNEEKLKLWSQNKLPEVYELDMKATSYNNTVVFSEQDLPGHRTQQAGGGKAAIGSRPGGIQFKSERYGQQQQLKKPGTYRTAIPKKTALAPQVVNEVIANPVEDDTSMDFFKLQYDNAMNAGKKTLLLADKIKKPLPTGNSKFTFGTLTSKPPGSKKKQAKEKAVRLPRSDLLDQLQRLFKEYQYWPLRALRNRTNQPEAWLKEVLEDIAYPMRSGRFAGNYRLNEQSARLLAIDQSEAQEEAAPDPDRNASDQGSGDESGAQDDDVDDDGEEVGDDDLELEDVV